MRGLIQILVAGSAVLGNVCTSDSKYPIELVILQDATASFSDDFAQMKNKQLKQIKKIFAKYPGTRYGVVSFRDKPIAPYGWPETDYCVRYEAALSEDFKVVEDVYSKMESTGGGDEYENSFGALLSTALSKNVGWSPKGSAEGGRDYTRIILLVTDAQPHTSTESNTKKLRAHNGKEDSADATTCSNYWYPSPEQVKAAIKKRDVYLFSLIQGGEKNLKAYQWFNEEMLGQPKEFVQTLSSDSSNFSELLGKVMAIVDEVQCGDGEPNKPGATDQAQQTLDPPAYESCPRMPEVCRQYLNSLP